ncbi:hypothetical protein KQX54_015704 [Cotesia glomerata]|uniref:Uncharacterized protein n=1 Tax=Cotesia glomerata TaxID=32391 RepID=A0AAV7HV82_COTGL|nr:hypothetical protein KQX54_015704 [Cotesia glomerata]
MDRLLNRYSQLKTRVGVLGDCYQLTETATATAIAECGESYCERVSLCRSRASGEERRGRYELRAELVVVVVVDLECRGDHPPLPPPPVPNRAQEKGAQHNKAMLDFAHWLLCFIYNPAADTEPDNPSETPPEDAVPETLALFRREKAGSLDFYSSSSFSQLFLAVNTSPQAKVVVYFILLSLFIEQYPGGQDTDAGCWNSMGLKSFSTSGKDETTFQYIIYKWYNSHVNVSIYPTLILDVTAPDILPNCQYSPENRFTNVGMKRAQQKLYQIK